jgi:hypothetical protein
MSEYREQCVFVQWLEHNKFKFSAIPNSTWTPSISQKMKNYRSGVRAGLPDLLVVVNQFLVFIEMKYGKNKPTKEQSAWMEALNKVPNVQCYVCYGATEAIETIQKINLIIK